MIKAPERVEEFIIGDILNTNRKPKDRRLNSFEAQFSEALAIDDLNMHYVAPSKFENMTDIERKLRSYIKSEGMKIMVTDAGGSEMFVNAPSGYCAIILTEEDVKQDANYRICSIAHELGHYFDYKHNFNFNSDEYNKFEEDVSETIKTEVVAWAYAKDILTVLGYDNFEYFNTIAVWALSSYTFNDIVLAQRCINDLDKFKQCRSHVLN